MSNEPSRQRQFRRQRAMAKCARGPRWLGSGDIEGKSRANGRRKGREGQRHPTTKGDKKGANLSGGQEETGHCLCMCIMPFLPLPLTQPTMLLFNFIFGGFVARLRCTAGCQVHNGFFLDPHQFHPISPLNHS